MYDTRDPYNFVRLLQMTVRPAAYRGILVSGLFASTLVNLSFIIGSVSAVLQQNLFG
jgi:hypothetical protein